MAQKKTGSKGPDKKFPKRINISLPSCTYPLLQQEFARITGYLSAKNYKGKTMKKFLLMLLIFWGGAFILFLFFFKNSFPQIEQQYKASTPQEKARIEFKLGYEAYEKNNIPQALWHYSRAIELNPNHANAHFNRGTLLNDIGHYQQALEDFNRAIALNPKDSSFYWDVKGRKARFADINSPELSRMASIAVAMESVSGTIATSIFAGVAANANATVADYINAINSMQTQIRAKYEMLNLK